MNKELALKANVVKEDLSSLPLVKEYLKLKNIIDNSKELRNLENKVKFLKRCDLNDEEKEEYYKAKEEYENNPLISNFKKLEKEIIDLKIEVKKILAI